MSDKVITSESEFEDIDLNVDDIDKIDKLTDEEVSLKDLEDEAGKPVEKVEDEIIDSLDTIEEPVVKDEKVSVDDLKSDIEKKNPIDNMGDIDISTDPDVAALINKVVDEVKEKPAEEPKKKRGRPAKKKEEETPKAPEVQKTETVPEESPIVIDEGKKEEEVPAPQVGPEELSGKSFYNPEFEVSNIKTDKYQTRQTQRSIEDIEGLCEKIKYQGLLVPVQIIKEGDEYQLVDGFGRLAAIKSLGIPKIKAVIHEGLSASDIMKLGTGANIGRSELSEWDKIYSIGKFWQENIENYKKEDLCKIFGYSKSVLYSYLELFDLFKTDNELVEMFQKIRIPFFFFSHVCKYLKQYPLVKLENLREFIKTKASNTLITKEKFESSLVVLCEKITKENTTSDDSTDIEIDIPNVKNVSEKKLTEELVNPPESLDVKVKIVIEQYFDNVLKCFKKAEDNFKGIMAINEFKNFIDSKTLSVVKAKVDAINNVMNKLI